MTATGIGGTELLQHLAQTVPLSTFGRSYYAVRKEVRTQGKISIGFIPEPAARFGIRFRLS